MFKKFVYPAVFAIAAVGFVACDDDNEATNLRPSISYSSLDTAVAYSDQFVDETLASTVDLVEGNSLHKMFQGLNYYNSSSITANASIDPQKLRDLFSNTGNPFVDVTTSTISINGAALNSSGFQLRVNVASSLSSTDAEQVREKIESLFDEIGTASESINQVASKGVAGKIDNYLVDADGIEITQVIQKSLIGALQLDYIGNVLLDEGLNADNRKTVTEENYTALEHNWDVAYSLLTLNPIYLRGATDAAKKTTEFAAGSYIWEYNKADYNEMYLAFLKGRAAIVNNDRSELEAQATFIRTAFEKAIANAAIGYLGKWKSGDTEAKRVHAFGEGLGFIYSLRFAKIHGSNAEFSDNLIEGLLDTEDGYWDLTADKINIAENAIREKFDL
jgi:hypothetical protein